jgi:hypothetical protein
LSPEEYLFFFKEKEKFPKMFVFQFALGLLLLLLDAEAKLCSIARPCFLGVVSCSESDYAPLCTYSFRGQRGWANQSVALQACRRKFGSQSTFATPGDANSNTLLKTMCKTHRFFDMKRRPGNQCAQWVTDDAVPITFFNWDSNEPSLCVDDCAGFGVNVNSGQWRDSRCTPNAPENENFASFCAICVLEPTSPPTPAPATPAPPLTLPSTSSAPKSATTVGATTTTQRGTSTSATTSGTVSPGSVSDAGPTVVITNGSVLSTRAPSGALDESSLIAVLASVFVSVICILVLVFLLLRARRKQKRAERSLAAYAQPVAQFPPPHTVIGQYFKPSPSPLSEGYVDLRANLQLPLRDMPAAGEGKYMTGEFLVPAGAHDGMLSAREDAPRPLPPAITSGAQYLPEPPKRPTDLPPIGDDGELVVTTYGATAQIEQPYRAPSPGREQIQKLPASPAPVVATAGRSYKSSLALSVESGQTSYNTPASLVEHVRQDRGDNAEPYYTSSALALRDIAPVAVPGGGAADLYETPNALRNM